MAFAAELLVEEPTPGNNNTNRSPFMAQPPRQDVPPPSPPPPPPPPPMEVSEDEGGGRSEDEGGHGVREMRTRDSPSFGPEVAVTPRSSPYGIRSSGSDTLITHQNPGSLHDIEMLYQATFQSGTVSRSPPTVESYISRSPDNTAVNFRRNPQTRTGSPPDGTAIRPGTRSPVKIRREISGSPSISPTKNSSNYSLIQVNEKSSSPSAPQQSGASRKSRQSRSLQPSNRQSPRVQFSVEGGREPVSAQGQKGMTSSLGFTKKISSREMQRHLRQKVQLAIEMWRQRMNKKPTPMARFGDYHQPNEDGSATARPTPRQSPKRPRFSSLGRAGNMASDTNNSPGFDRPVSAEGPARGRMMEPTLNRSRLGSNSRSPSVSATRKPSVARHDCHSKSCSHPSHNQENKRGSTPGGGGITVKGKRRERTGRRRNKADAARSSSSGEGDAAMSSSRSALASPPSSASKRGQNLGNASSRSKSKIPRLVDEKPKKGPTPRSADQQRGRGNFQDMMQQQSLPLSRDMDDQFGHGHSDTALSPVRQVSEPLEDCIDLHKAQGWLSCHDQTSPRESGVGDEDDFDFEDEEERLLYDEEGDNGADTGYRGDEEGADEEEEEEEAEIARELQAVAQARQAKRLGQKPNSRSLAVPTCATTPPPSTAVTAVAFVQQPQLLGSAGDNQLSGSKGTKVVSHGKSSVLMEGKSSRPLPPPGHAPPAEPVPSPELDVSQLVASGKAKVCAWVGEWTHPVGRRIGILLPADAVYPPGAPKPLLLQTMVDMELNGVSEDTRNDIIRKRQRQEVYALNRIMTSLEFAQFENFCRTHNIPLSI